MWDMVRTRFARALFLLLATVGAAGCATETEEQEASPDALRADPNGEVSTNDPSVRLLSGYNSFLDRASTTACILPQAPEQPNVGDVRSTFYLRHVKTREELAKELDVDVGVSLSAPAGSVDASTKVVKTFKQSSTTVTFLVRSLRSYTVANRASLVLSPEAEGLLAQNNMYAFLRKCGGSFVQSVRYEAQVLGLLQFEAKNEESARKIAAKIGGSGTSAIRSIANASGEVKTQAEQTASEESASLSLTVLASGFLSRGKAAGDILGNTFEKVDELRAEMADSFDADLAADRQDYFANRSRNVRPAIVGQNSYAQVSNAPHADFTQITTMLARAEEFVRYLGPVQLRMETVYTDEVMRFLGDAQGQYRYNLGTDPKLKTSDLIPIAQKWATSFGPDGTRNPGSLIDPLRLDIERCQSAASNGNYEACTTDPEIDRHKAEADAALLEYARTGRIVPTSAWMPRLNTTLSYYRAEDECAAAGMRLPKRSEMRLIAPAVTALATPSGEVWFAGDDQCAKPYFKNGSGEGAFACTDSLAEPLPYVQDKPVVCVSRSGAVTGFPPP